MTRIILLVDQAMYRAAEPRRFRQILSLAMADLAIEGRAMVGYRDLHELEQRLRSAPPVDTVIFFSHSMINEALMLAERRFRVCILTDSPDLVTPSQNLTIMNKADLFDSPGRLSSQLGM